MRVSTTSSGPSSPVASASVSGVPPNLFWVNTLLTGCAIVLAVVASGTSWWLAKEVKQLQIQVMDQNALALRNGWRQPTDEVYGPAGNLEYRPKEK